MRIGEVIAQDREIVLNEDRPTRTVQVIHTGDRPVQVGSHFHFFEVNKCLAFDRARTYGYRLDIPSGTAVRFEPGETKTVQLVAVAGRREIYGFSDLTCGVADDSTLEVACAKAQEQGFAMSTDIASTQNIDATQEEEK